MADGLSIGPGFEILPGEVVHPVVMTVDPAAGVEVSIAVPGSAVWEILSARVELVTDATVANRRPSLRVSDGTDELIRSLSGSQLAASLAGVFCWFEGGVGFGLAGANGAITGVMPPIPILGGFVISTITENLQAGDNYGRMTLYVRERSARGARAQAELFQEVLRELVRRAQVEDLVGPDPLGALVARMFGVPSRY